MWMPNNQEENKRIIKEANNYFFGKTKRPSREQLSETKKSNIIWLRFWTLFNNYYELLDDSTRNYIHAIIEDKI